MINSYCDANNKINTYKDKGYASKSFMKFDSLNIGVPKVLPIASSNINGDTRMGAWGFSRSDHGSVINFHASDFAGMNTPSVVAARGWSGPGIKMFAQIKDRHGVFTFDFFNIIPAKTHSRKWVMQRQTFSEKDYLWSDEYSVSNLRSEQAPKNSLENCYPALVPKTLDDENQRGNKNNRTASKGASGAKSFTSAHSTIFSRQRFSAREMVAA
jgi:hypothetical protein